MAVPGDYANSVLANKDANRATALKLYTGEVLKAFNQKNIALGTVKNRTIQGGSSAQFIVSGAAASGDIQTHTRGAAVTPVLLGNDERTISVSTRLVHSHFLDAVDEKIAQWDVMSEMARQSGIVLSDKIDTDVFQLIGDAIITAPLVGQSYATVVDSGEVSEAAYNALTSTARGDILIDMSFQAQVALDQKNVPTDGRIMVLDRQSYADLVQSNKGTNIDYVDRGNGSISNGRIAMMADLPIMWTNNLPATIGATTTALEGTPLGFVYTPDVAGVVTLIGLKSELNYDYIRLGHLLVSYYALGMGVLNPSCVVGLMNMAQADSDTDADTPQ